MSNLNLVPTNELVEELVRRNDSIVIAGVKWTKANGEYMTIRRYAGNRMVCSGLITIVNQMIVTEELHQTIPLKDNEDR